MTGGADQNKRLDFVDGCVRAYGAATKFISELYERESGASILGLSGPPKQRYRQALRLYADLIRDKAGRTVRADLENATAIDPVLADLLSDSLPVATNEPLHDIDDVSPNIFKDAVYGEIAAQTRAGETVDVDLDAFLRAVVTRVMDEIGWQRRLNVGVNRHFPRMLQWLREVVEETASDDGFGIRLMNRSGRGRVASEPEGPAGLKVRLDPDML